MVHLPMRDMPHKGKMQYGQEEVMRMNTNSENPKVGKAFQEDVCRRISEYFNTEFELEVAVPIGYPAKEHRFDCVSVDGRIIVECKCYVWTDSGNVPSAKLRELNEALLFMSFLPEDAVKIICMKKSRHPRTGETLAEYYACLYGHMMRDVRIFELDEQDRFNIIRG